MVIYRCGGFVGFFELVDFGLLTEGNKVVGGKVVIHISVVN